MITLLYGSLGRSLTLSLPSSSSLVSPQWSILSELHSVSILHLFHPKIPKSFDGIFIFHSQVPQQDVFFSSSSRPIIPKVNLPTIHSTDNCPKGDWLFIIQQAVHVCCKGYYSKDSSPNKEINTHDSSFSRAVKPVEWWDHTEFTSASSGTHPPT